MKKWQFLITGILMMLLLSIGCKKETPGEPSAVVFQSAVQWGGTSGTADSTELTLSFDSDPTTLAGEDITVTGATKGKLSGSGTNRTLAISNMTVDNGQTVSVAIKSPSGYSIISSPQTAVIYRKTYNLRDTGPAGGLIFYDKGSYSDGWRYLEAAPVSTEWNSKQWGKHGTRLNGTENRIGTGKSNSAVIVAKLNEAPADSDRAAQLCDALAHGGYDDWFLPSLYELNQMYVNLKSMGVGNFSNHTYWSSSEIDENIAWSQGFTNGNQGFNVKNSYPKTRAARAF